MTDTTTTPASHLDLTEQERQADLDLDQLKQLVGLVEYDEKQDPFPVTGWDAIGLRRRQRHPDRALLPVAPGAWSSSPTPAPRTATATTSPSCSSPARSGSCSTARSAPTARCSTTTASTATASSTSRSRCPTSTAASSRPAAPGATVLAGAARRHRRARHGPRSPPSRRTARPGTPSSTALAASYAGPYLPGYVAAASTFVKRDGAPKRLFQALDHVVGNVELGKMDEWVEFYNKVMGFVNMAEFIGDDIATDYSALMSKVVANGNHRVKFPLNEPAIAQARSRRSTSTSSSTPARAPSTSRSRPNDILRTVDALRDKGVEFLDTPDSYYDDPELRARIGEVRVPIEELQGAQDPGRPRRGRLPAADLHQAARRPPDGVLRAHRAARLARLRQGQLQGAVRGDRARAGPARQPLSMMDRCTAPSSSRARCCRLAPTPHSRTPSSGAGGASSSPRSRRVPRGPDPVLAAFRRGRERPAPRPGRGPQQRRALRGGRRGPAPVVLPGCRPAAGVAVTPPWPRTGSSTTSRVSPTTTGCSRRGPGGGTTTTSRPSCRTRRCWPASGPRSGGCRWPTSAPGSGPPTAGSRTRRPTSRSVTPTPRRPPSRGGSAGRPTVLDGALHLHHLVDPDAVADRGARPRRGPRRVAQERSWSRGDDHGVTGRGTATPSSSRSVRSE